MEFAQEEKQLIRRIVREEIDESLDDKLQEFKLWLLRECRI